MSGNVLDYIAKGVNSNYGESFAEGLSAGAQQQNELAKAALLKQQQDEMVAKHNALAALAGKIPGIAGQLMSVDPSAGIEYLGYDLKRQQLTDSRNLINGLFSDSGGGGAGAPPPSPTDIRPIPPGAGAAPAPDAQGVGATPQSRVGRFGVNDLPRLYEAKARADAANATDGSQAISSIIAGINNENQRSVEQQKVDIERRSEERQLMQSDQGKYTLQTIRGGRKAAEDMNMLDLVDKYMDDPSFISGKWTSIPRDAQRALRAYGFMPGADPSEVFNALRAKLTKDTLGSFGSGISDADRMSIEAQFPADGTSKASNKQIVAIHRALDRRQLLISQKASEYLKSHNTKVLDDGFETEMADYANKHSIFGDVAAGVSNDRQAARAGITPEENMRRQRQMARETGGIAPDPNVSRSGPTMPSTATTTYVPGAPGNTLGQVAPVDASGKKDGTTGIVDGRRVIVRNGQAYYTDGQ